MNVIDNRPRGISVSDSDYLPDVIKNLNLGPIRFKLMSNESPVKWDETFAKQVEEEYRKFLTLTLEAGGQPVVPDGLLDVYWHQHILDTEKYAEDCNIIFGKFIHHFPYFGLRGDEDQAELQESFKKTVEKYKKKLMVLLKILSQ